ncbi:MAG: hypothetical protein GX876_10410 [Bacteroidales bacterium]|nr:hypothetical protein [Bacteroidales bacterium]
MKKFKGTEKENMTRPCKGFIHKGLTLDSWEFPREIGADYLTIQIKLQKDETGYLK